MVDQKEEFLQEAEQLALIPGFGDKDVSGQWTVPLPGAPTDRITSDSSLGLALHWFAEEMVRLKFAQNTRETYQKAVALLARYLGPSSVLHTISPGDLKRFQGWVEERANSPKTAEVKLTAVRRFFVALYEAKILPVNVAADMWPCKAESPLPVVLYPGQADAVRRLAAQISTRPDDPDPRPALLITLLLDMGLRLGETLSLHVDDVDVSNSLAPVVRIRYESRRHQAKRRALNGPPVLTHLYNQQIAQHEPGQKELFGASRRTLQYIVQKVGEEAGLHRTLTPSTLRWTYALQQFNQGVDTETLRRRLGFSERGWATTLPRIQKLAQRPV